jgi:molybdenum-dependent DNA-binding transcriptional regulator ModE
MNACFREPLIKAAKGGIGGGGARLTAMGREVLALYRAMEDHATAAVDSVQPFGLPPYEAACRGPRRAETFAYKRRQYSSSGGLKCGTAFFHGLSTAS